MISNAASLLVMQLLMIVYAAAVVGATTCPVAGDPVINLLNGTSYVFSSCSVPVNATGVNVVGVSLVLDNSFLGAIFLTGSLLQNFSAAFTRVQMTSAMNIGISISALVSNVSLLFVDSVAEAGAFPYIVIVTIALEPLVAANLTGYAMEGIFIHVSGCQIQRPLLNLRAGVTLSSSRLSNLNLTLSNTSISVNVSSFVIFSGTGSSATTQWVVERVLFVVADHCYFVFDATLGSAVFAFYPTVLSVMRDMSFLMSNSIYEGGISGSLITSGGTSIDAWSIIVVNSSITAQGWIPIYLRPSGTSTISNLLVRFSSVNATTISQSSELMLIGALHLDNTSFLFDKCHMDVGAGVLYMPALSSSSLSTLLVTIIRSNMTAKSELFAWASSEMLNMSLFVVNSTLISAMELNFAPSVLRLSGFVFDIRGSTLLSSSHVTDLGLNSSAVVVSIINSVIGGDRFLFITANRAQLHDVIFSVENTQVNLTTSLVEVGQTSRIISNALITFTNATLDATEFFLVWVLVLADVRVVVRGSVVNLLSKAHLVGANGWNKVTNLSVHLANTTILNARGLLWFAYPKDNSAPTVQQVDVVADNVTGRFILDIMHFESINVTIDVSITLNLVNFSTTGALLFARSNAFMSGLYLKVLRSLLIGDLVSALTCLAQVRDVQVLIEGSGIEGNEILQFFCNGAPATLDQVNVLITRSNMTTSKSIFYVGNVVSCGSTSMTVMSSIINTTFVMWQVGRIDVLTGEMSIVVGNLSTFIGQGINAQSSGKSIVFVRRILRNKGLLSFSLTDSTVLIKGDPSQLLTSMSIFLLANSTVDCASGGSIVARIANSTIHASQLGTCTAFSLTSVGSTVAKCVRLVIAQSTQLLLTCTTTSTVVNVGLCNSASFDLLVESKSNISLESAATVGKDVFGLLQGSFVVLILSSEVARPNITIRDCSVSCGLICQVIGLYWCDSVWYYFAASTILDNTVTVQSGNAIHGGLVLIARCTFAFISSTNSAISKSEQRPAVSFNNASGVSVTFVGPQQMPQSVFSGVYSSDGQRKGNSLALLNCETIYFLGMSLAEAISPRHHPEIALVTRRSGGRGTCDLSSTQTRSVDSESIAPTPSMTLTSSTSNVAAASPPKRRSMSTAQAVLAGALSILVVASGPVASTSLQAMHDLSVLAACPDMSAVMAPDFPTSPTQMNFGPDDLAHVRGTVVGNVLLFVSCCAVAALMLAIVPEASFETLALPGLLYQPYSMLAVPTATAIMTLFTLPQVQSDILAAVGGLLFVVMPWITFLVFMTLKFGAKTRRIPLAARRGGSSLISRHLWRWCNSPAEYLDVPQAPGFVRRWEWSGFDAYRSGKQWFGTVEIAVSIGIGLISGSSAAGRRWCRGLQLIALALLCCQLGLQLSLRPYSAPIELWGAIANAALLALTGLLALIGIDASAALSVVMLAVNSVVIISKLYWTALDRGICHLLHRRNLHPAQPVHKTKSSGGIALTSEEMMSTLMQLQSSAHCDDPLLRREAALKCLDFLIRQICLEGALPARGHQ